MISPACFDTVPVNFIAQRTRSAGRLLPVLLVLPVLPVPLVLLVSFAWPAGAWAAAAEEPDTAGPSVTESRHPTPQLPILPAESPRQLLNLLGLSDSLLNAFGEPESNQAETSGAAVHEEALIRVLHSLPKVGLDDIARWEQAPVPWAALVTAPAEHRIRFFHIAGHALQSERVSLSTRLAELFDFDHFYRVRIRVAEIPCTVAICTRRIPVAWQSGLPPEARVEATGLFLQGIGSAPAGTTLVFAAPRLAWLPERPDPARGIGPAQVLLGDLGMDVGLFDRVRTHNGQRMGVAERECFYQLLAAASRAQPNQLESVAQPGDLPTLLQHPERLHGDVFRVQGTVCRITKVLLTDDDIRARFHLEHYYQLDVLVPLGDHVVQTRGPAADGTPGPVYRNSFPFTFCCVRLPPTWIDLIDDPQLSRPVAVTGFFYKLWAYPNPLVTEYDRRQRQVSPMFVAVAPQTPPPRDGAQSKWGAWLAVVFVGVLGAVWLFVWQAQRADRRFTARALRSATAPSKPPNWEELDAPDRAAADE